MIKKILYGTEFETIKGGLDSLGIRPIEVELGISIKSLYYSGDNFLLLCRSLRKDILDNAKKYNIAKFRIFLADSLNRHTLYYRYKLHYIDLNHSSIIPYKTKEKMKHKAFKSSRNQGVKWFYDNLEAINELIPDGCKITENFQLNDKITTLYEGDKSTPKIEIMRYNYWLEHPEYEETFKALTELCSNEKNLIEKAFQYEVAYFIERVKRRNEEIANEELMREQSYKYLFDETVSFIIKHREQNNLIEFYFGGGEPKPTLTFRGRRAKNDPVIQKYLQGPLKGADQRKHVSVKLVE